MLSCKEIIKRINSEKQPSFFQKAEMRLHLMMCEHCAAYAKHLGFIQVSFKKLFLKKTKTEEKKIKDLEDQIIKKLKN